MLSTHDDEKSALTKRLDDICDMLQQFLQKQNDVDSRLTATELALQDKVDNKMVQDCCKRLDAIEARGSGAPQAELDQTDAKQPVGRVSTTGGPAAVSSLVDKNVPELQDRERSKHNIIFFNVPESRGADAAVRMQDDLNTINKLILEQMHVLAAVSAPVRFGPRPSGDAKPRPLRVTVNSED